ncbi:MAG: Spx/MgsR family transcriptional regulator [Gammaproteobacteria bacterium]|nr:MAG: Spx/MgsR family transcriptional regulator [Gammaproteobacteria bacterium]TND07109.1 MAG: Spx/MgsR family transcriptional regulator [Gammaproteobacteria bacterium]
MTTLYGISNCDTVRRARRWLADNAITYRFHDVRKDGLDEATVQRWVTELGWETLINRSGRTWRTLPEDIRADLRENKAITLMTDEPTLIKRPVLRVGDRHFVGFKEHDYQRIFG